MAYRMTRLSVACWLVLAACAVGAQPPATLRYRVDVASPTPVVVPLFRGETVDIEIELVERGVPFDLSTVYDASFRYRPTSAAPSTYYSVAATVQSATGGLVRVPWTPAAELIENQYLWTLWLQTPTAGDMPRTYGSIVMRGTVSGALTNTPERVQGVVDWSSVAHVNLISAPFVSDADISGIETRVGGVETGKVDVADWIDENAALREEIADAGALDAMGGDVTGPSTNAAVVKVRGVPVGVLTPGAGTDGYGLKYDHPSGGFVLGPVASESGSASNLLTLSGTAVSTDVDGQEIGIYRSVRPGYLPTAVVNVGGYEVVYLDLLGITLRAGSLYLLNDVLSVNPAAYDGSVTQPAYSWNGQRHLGKYRLSYDGGYGEGFTVSSNLVWFWAADGIHLQPGTQIFGLPYADQITVVSQRVDTVEGWGNHAQAGYAFTVTVAQVASNVGAVSQRVDTVQGWGNHAQAGYASTVTVAQVASALEDLTPADIGAASQTHEHVIGDVTGLQSAIEDEIAGDEVITRYTFDNGDYGIWWYVQVPGAAEWVQMALPTNGLLKVLEQHPAGPMETPAYFLDINERSITADMLYDVYATSGTVALISANVGAVSQRMDTVEGWGDHGQAGYASTVTVAQVAADVGAVSQRVDTVEGTVTNTIAGYAIDGRYEIIDEYWWYARVPGYTNWVQMAVTTNGMLGVEYSFPDGPWAPPVCRMDIRTGSITSNQVDAATDAAYRAHAVSLTNNTPTAVTPRWVGDELVIHTATQMIYRAFGLTTNDWVQTWP